MSRTRPVIDGGGLAPEFVTRGQLPPGMICELLLMLRPFDDRVACPEDAAS